MGLDKTREEFEALVDKTYNAVKNSSLPQTREGIAKDLLTRLAQRASMTVEEAEKALDASAATPEPEPVAAPRKKTDLKEAAKSMRELTAKGPYFSIAKEDQQMIETMIALNRVAGINANMLITGPSGCGKTEMVEHAANNMGIPFLRIDCPSVTSDDKWIGHKEFDPAKGTTYIMSDFLRALEGKDVLPGIILLDELSRLHPTRLNIVFPLLAGTRSIWVPELGITVEKHPEVVIMATANIGSGFTGTHRMDDALVGRFGFRMEKTWPTAADETKILINRTGVDEADAKMLVSIAAETRAKASRDDLPFPVSTRDLLNASALVAAGMTIAQAAEWTFVKFYEEGTTRASVKLILQGKAGGK